MPAQVKVTIKASQLQATDTVTTGSREVSDYFAHRIHTVSVKTKYVWVRFENGSESRFGVDEDVVVFRQQATLAEIEEATRRYAVYVARKEINDVETRLEETRAKLLEDLDYRPDYHRQSYANYVEAQELAKIWRRVASLATADGVSLVDAMYEVRDELTESLTEQRFGSRSTSGLANEVENLESDAKVTWLRRVKYVIPARTGR